MQHCRLACAVVMVNNLAKVLLGLFKVDVQAYKVLQVKALPWHAALQCTEEGTSCLSVQDAWPACWAALPGLAASREITSRQAHPKHACSSHFVYNQRPGEHQAQNSAGSHA